MPRRASAVSGALLVVAATLMTAPGHRAYADATAPPTIPPSECPSSQFPPSNYQNPTNDPYATPPNYTADPNPPANPPVAYHGQIPYKVPFSGSILDGQIYIPGNSSRPSVLVPHVYAAICGQVLLPQLTGVINGSDPTVAGNPPGGVHFAPHSPNVYVDGSNPSVADTGYLEALPITVNFTQPLVAPIVPVAAPNGGLNISITTSNQAAQTSLGMTCSLVLNNVTFTTQTSGALTGKPVTGPTAAGMAEAVSNNFPVPAVQASNTCPPAVAATYNKLLGLPLPAGVASFTSPFTFVFELDCPPPPGQSASDYPYQCPTGGQS
ncbi:MAG TPA: hypothetical protein VKU91_10075 [Acidimicrobiales bacterium]|nr:hypothetical protein [Acidimicrobiales bacterium]